MPTIVYRPGFNVAICMAQMFKYVYNSRDSQLLFKDECLLVSLHYNKSQNQLVVSPDINDLEYNSYDIESETGILGFEYAVELEFEDKSTGELDMLVYNVVYISYLITSEFGLILLVK